MQCACFTHTTHPTPHRRPSLAHGKVEKYFNPAVKAQRVLYSLFIIVLMILLVLGLVSVVFYLQYYITSDNVSDALDFVYFSMFSSLYRVCISASFNYSL